MSEMQVVTTAVREWIAGWGAEVAAEDFAAARLRFSADVVGFGTFAGVARGLDELEARQWRNVWPSISSFRFQLDDLIVIASPDGRQAVAAVSWDSLGHRPDGTHFPRRGRATVVLQRASGDEKWLGIHTHFSLVPT